MKITRREFLKLATLVGAGFACPAVLKAQLASSKGQKGRKWAMAIDLNACEKPGCTDCIEACHRVHNVPRMPLAKEEVRWIWTSPYEELFPGQRARKDLRGKPVLALCNHCENPPCVAVCPTKATFKRSDGIVMMDYHRCIGCRYCMAACPYGARSFNWRDPRPFIARMEMAYPTRTKGVVEKCNFCEERLVKGLVPACVEACKERRLVFGDLNDEASEVRRVLDARSALQRKPELGTQPKVFYLL